MTEEIDIEVVTVLERVRLEQHKCYENTGRCYKKLFVPTNIKNLTYNTINYWNNVQGAGYGVTFSFTDFKGTEFEMSIDFGFIDPDIVLKGTHPITEFDWREKNVS